VVLPCELIDRNGDALLSAVLETARAWDLPPAFVRWVGEACTFANTLVDRIVTGHPRDEAGELAARLGYRDELLVAGELFHSWVIEAPTSLADELPLAAAGLDVVETRDLGPYRERKVRILNGAHTLMALVGFLAGQDTVGGCMADDLVRSYVERTLAREIWPGLSTAAALASDVEAFTAAVAERFRNPFIRHPLSAIALNSVSKFRTRLLPALLEGARATGRPPPHLTFALAALAALYRANVVEDGALIGRRGGVPYRLQDEPRVLAFFLMAWRAVPAGAETPDRCLALARRFVEREELWGQDLEAAAPGLAAAVAVFLHALVTEGAVPALGRLVEGEPRRSAGGSP
jgi:mannitol-1-phosphate/altronate dehydrogenase